MAGHRNVFLLIIKPKSCENRLTFSFCVSFEDYEFFESTLLPTTTTVTITTTTESEIVYPETSVVGTGPVSEYDIAGKKRFTGKDILRIMYFAASAASNSCSRKISH